MKLEPLFLDTSITEITINSFQSIWVEKNGKLEASNIAFESDHEYFLFIKEICRDLNIDSSLLQPFINGKWGQFRVHITCDHISKSSYLISFRRIRDSIWTLNDFLENNFLNELQHSHILTILSEKKNILVVGPTGSGKTSFLSALLGSLKENERCVLLEDTDELPIPTLSSTKMLTFEAEQALIKSVNLTELVKQSLRMRPDRLVVGEIRGNEAKDLLLALSTGHAGSMGTLHANSASEALLRLEMLVQMGAPDWALETIRRLLFLSIQIVFVVGKDENGKRKLISIDKVHSLESFGIVTEPYQFTSFPNSNKWEGRGKFAF